MVYNSYDAIGLFGALIIAVMYFATQVHRSIGVSKWFFFSNITGSSLILSSLIMSSFNLASFVIESLWIIASLYGLWDIRDKDKEIHNEKT